VYAVIRTSSAGWNDPVTLVMFVAGAALLMVFVAVESRVGQPIMPLRLFADRNRTAAYVNGLLIPATFLGLIYFVTQFMQNSLGYGPLQAGIAFLPFTLAIVVTVRMMPQLIRRFGAMPLIVIGAASRTGALVWLTQLSATSSYATNLLGPLLLAGAGAGLTTVALSTTVLAGVPPEDSGAASGIYQTFQWSSWSLGLAVLVAVFSRAIAQAGGDQRAAFAHGTATAFTVASAFTACSIVVALLCYSDRQRPNDTSSDRLFLSRRRSLITGDYEALRESGVQQFIRDLAEAAGITKRVHPHLFRHSAATHMLRQGMNPLLVAQVLGHSSLAMIQGVYSHLTAADMHTALMDALKRGDR
jgi:hypothetical protein